MSEATASLPELVPADAAGLSRARRLIAAGQPVAVPTETVYGLAARADDAAAVARIYAAKGRPDFNPLIVHVADLVAAQALAHFDDRAMLLARQFWPGALTMVLPLRDDAGLAAAVTAGLPTVALRMPAHPVMQAVLADAPFPLAAPSANRSGAVSPTCAAHVASSLAGRIPLVLDGGKARQGLESSIVALREDGWQMLRPGPVTQEDVTALLGPPLAGSGKGIEAPGQLASHYAPGKPVRLDVTDPDPDEFFIGFKGVGGDCSLSTEGDLEEAAARLYACLHMGARSEEPRIAVAPIPRFGIGKAINDRLRRAATPPD